MSTRRFQLHRHTDPTGISGPGIVADGVQFADGVTVVHWRGDRPSTVVWPRIEDALHVHGHAAATEFVWLDEPEAAIEALDQTQVWVLPRTPIEHDGWLERVPRRGNPAWWRVNAMSFGEDYMDSAEAREFAAWYLAAADECDRRNAPAPAADGTHIQEEAR